MAKRLIARFQSKRRIIRMRGSILSNFRVWHKTLKQQIFLGRKLGSYLYPTPVFLQRSLEKNDVLHLLRIAETHNHQDVPLLWDLLDNICWVDALCFLIQWGLHNTPSFKYVQDKIDLNTSWDREKIVFTAIEHNNINALNAMVGAFGCINNNPGRHNCLLEIILSEKWHFCGTLNTWGVTSSQNISSCLLFLIHHPISATDFWIWYDQVALDIRSQCLNEFENHFRFVKTPYETKEFVASQHDNPVLVRYSSFLAARWKTPEGFQCCFEDHSEVFYSTPCAANSALIAQLSAANASVFIYAIAPHVDVPAHFLWALKTNDFDLAALLLPFLPSSFSCCETNSPSPIAHPFLYNQLQAWTLTAVCQGESFVHTNERMRKI